MTDHEAEGPSYDADRAGEDDRQAAASHAEELVSVRLAPDGMTLELQLQPEARRASRDELAEALCAACEPLGLDPAMTPERAVACLRGIKAGDWAVIAQGTPSTAPVNGTTTLLLRPCTAGERQWFHPRVPVRANDAIVRVTPARDGIPGQDLRGRSLAALPARQPAIPAGENTMLGEDEQGPAVLATCDGEIVLEHTRLAVRPMRLVTARELTAQPRLIVDGAVFVLDRVPPRAEVVATGDIVVAGDVDAADLESREGTVTVLGCVTGYHNHHCRVRAAGDANLVSALYADVTTPCNVRIQTQARHASLTAGANLYLLTRLRGALYEVDLRIAGAVIPADNPSSQPDVPATERNTFHLPCDVACMAALYDPVQVAFRPCRIVGLSIAGARLHAPVAEGQPTLPPDRTVLLKIMLPDAPGAVQILGRTLATPGEGIIPVAFRQLSHQDEARITAFCLAGLRALSQLSRHGDEMITPGA